MSCSKYQLGIFTKCSSWSVIQLLIKLKFSLNKWGCIILAAEKTTSPLTLLSIKFGSLTDFLVGSIRDEIGEAYKTLGISLLI